MLRLPVPTVLLTVLTGLTGLTGLPTTALAPATAGAAVAPAAQQVQQAQDALERARIALDPRSLAGRAGAAAPVPEATLALRDLLFARADLTGDDRLEADALLARPTDGADDPYGDGYLVPSEMSCTAHFCLHWVRLSADAPPSADWVASTLEVLERVWRKEVSRLGYRAPLSDAGYPGNGGNGKFDVYLKELGGRGLYGYCAPEHAAAKAPRTASGFCVLDNDFSPQQYGAPAEDSRAVTAAHEFFHAIQFAYDAREDPWLMESTATWMEERFADRVDDNRQYLPYSQIAAPRTPLDLFDPDGLTQYGNWVWWEFLSGRFGTTVVRRVWQRAAGDPGAPGEYSTQAIRSALERHGGFTRLYGLFTVANLVPARYYSEGRAWPSAPLAGTVTLTPARPAVATSMRLDHLTSIQYRLVPGSGWGRGTRARVAVSVPSSAGAATALVAVRTRSGWSVTRVPLRGGRGAVSVPFSAREVRWAAVSLVNASTRFACGDGDADRRYSCDGRPRDDARTFKVAVTVRGS
ncbi:hypothetical protein GCM10022215_02280 [Nocardioides fonticola]|uniref:Uncharacterized protein n=1 Tax=Nocardioides fonticola TaxID=450363 RepID=A0ABP7XC39_9ACTN